MSAKMPERSFVGEKNFFLVFVLFFGFLLLLFVYGFFQLTVWRLEFRTRQFHSLAHNGAWSWQLGMNNETMSQEDERATRQNMSSNNRQPTGKNYLPTTQLNASGHLKTSHWPRLQLPQLYQVSTIIPLFHKP